MAEFKKYKRVQISELREVTDYDIEAYKRDKKGFPSLRDIEFEVSISQEDLNNGSPKIGDMIARNPKNHKDQWLVAEEYFKNNFKELEK